MHCCFGGDNSFSGLFFCKQKGVRVFRGQEVISVVLISALSSTKYLAKIFGERFIISLKST